MLNSCIGHSVQAMYSRFPSNSVISWLPLWSCCHLLSIWVVSIFVFFFFFFFYALTVVPLHCLSSFPLIYLFLPPDSSSPFHGCCVIGHGTIAYFPPFSFVLTFLLCFSSLSMFFLHNFLFSSTIPSRYWQSFYMYLLLPPLLFVPCFYTICPFFSLKAKQIAILLQCFIK